jgi:hypothetical protein
VFQKMRWRQNVLGRLDDQLKVKIYSDIIKTYIYTGASKKNATILNYCNYVNYYLKTI